MSGQRALVSAQDAIDELPHVLGDGLASDEVSIRPHNLLYSVELAHHFLVVAVALRSRPRFYDIAHNYINFHALPLLIVEVEQLPILNKEVDVFTVFSLVPIVKRLPRALPFLLYW